jgi:hypothetical protein
MKLKSIQLLLLLTFSLMQISFDASAEKPTNFVLIYIDDMGYGDIALTGAIGYTTPNLDKMAASGMFFRAIIRHRQFAAPRGPGC